ncbi:hypothetical protein ACVFYP_23970 [Roseomonas sp. F4]
MEVFSMHMAIFVNLKIFMLFFLGPSEALAPPPAMGRRSMPLRVLAGALGQKVPRLAAA